MTVNFVRLEDRVRSDEGYNPKPHKDTLGVWMIAFGSTYWRAC